MALLIFLIIFCMLVYGSLFITSMLPVVPFPPSNSVFCSLDDEFGIVDTMVPLLSHISIKRLLYTQPSLTGHKPIYLCAIFDIRALLNCRSQKPFDSRSQIRERNHFLLIRAIGFQVKCTTKLNS